MKIKLLLLITLTILIVNNGAAQDDQGYSITWHNGNVTLLKDLGKVDLHLKNGKTINNVKIHRINEEKETIEYEKNKTMHDLPFRDFKNASAGKYSINVIYLNAGRKLAIKENPELTEGDDLQNFPVSYKAENKPAEFVTSGKDSASPSSMYGTSDTLVKGSEIIPVKIIELNAEIIRYIRRDIEDGPLYIISRKPEMKFYIHKGYVKIQLNN